MQPVTPTPPRRPGVPLGERPVVGHGSSPIGDQVRPTGARRHCWVRGPVEAPGPHQGLVLAWRKVGSQWTAWVVYVVEDEDGEVTTVQQWVGQDLASPA